MNDRFLENSMVVGATDEYERRFPEVSEREQRDKAMDALCDGFWDDHMPTKEMREQMEHICLAVDLDQSDESIARLTRYFVELAAQHAQEVM